jgi:hypothetical protein
VSDSCDSGPNRAVHDAVTANQVGYVGLGNGATARGKWKTGPDSAIMAQHSTNNNPFSRPDMKTRVKNATIPSILTKDYGNGYTIQ